jgi:hypothetical protein
MAADLRKRAAVLSQGNGLYVGGLDPADAAKDAGLIQPAFKRGMMDFTDSRYPNEEDL